MVMALGTLLLGCSGEENVAVGMLEWDRVELVAEASEPIVEFAVKEGEAVTQGDVLLRLDDRRLQAQLDQAEAALAEAQARLAELERGPRRERIDVARARLKGAQAALAVRNRELQRLQRLEQSQLASPDELDAARRQRDAALAERDQARAVLRELQTGATKEELEQARQRLAQAAAAARALGISLERLTVRAPVDGRVDDLPYELGEQPAIGDVVAVMLAGDRPYARVYIPEHLRVHIRPGTSAEIAVDGIAQPFKGIVRKVASDPTFTPYFALTEHDRGRLSYVAEIDLESTDQDLPAGIPVEASFPNASVSAP
jgi:HlyD family secretion protein